MKKLVVANWKMNPQTPAEAKKLFASVEHRLHSIEKEVEVAVCPPFVFFPILSQHAGNVRLGAQNMSAEEKGAWTGEISPLHLKSFKVEYVILGHSERREYFGETGSMVNKKAYLALKHKITPIICLGAENITKQFNAVTRELRDIELQKIVYVYEPAWAISTAKNSKPETGDHVNEQVLHIENLLAKKLRSQAKAKNIRILYGGSVNKGNVHDFAKHPAIDGCLVGAASLDSENFWQVIKEFSK